MKRLTQKDKCENWNLEGLPWEDLQEGKKITKGLWERLYGALWKLMEYEDTGLTPEEVEKVNTFDQSQSWKLLKKLKEEQCKHRWIPIGERLPENNDYILLSFGNSSLLAIGRYEADDEGGAFYLGDDDGEDTCVSQDLFVNAWMPIPESYR